MISLSFGRGSLVVDGGVISVLSILAVAIGASIAIEVWASLNLLGLGALSGIIGSFANVREMSPLVAGIAFAAQAGARMTAEIGSMRIAEEIDAIEAMGLRALPYVVGTRFLGALLIVVPGFALTLLVSFFVSNLMIAEVYGSAQGHLPALFRSVPVADRPGVFHAESSVLLRRGDDNPLLLRLFRVRGSGRRRCGFWTCCPRKPGCHHGAGLRTDRGVVGPQTDLPVHGVGIRR